MLHTCMHATIAAVMVMQITHCASVALVSALSQSYCDYMEFHRIQMWYEGSQYAQGHAQ